MRRTVKFSVAILVMCVLVILSIHRTFYFNFSPLSSWSADTNRKDCTAFAIYAEEAHSCIAQHWDERGLVAKLPQIVELCTHYLATMLPMHILRNKDDEKGYVPAVRNVTFSCQVLTLGIGADISAELQLKAFAPNCAFYGADPIEESGHIYRGIGTYYPFAVANQSGDFMAHVLLHPNRSPSYAIKTAKTLSFTNLLELAKLSNIIDVLLVDNEGAEYGLLPMFQSNYIHRRKLPIMCQISMELHGPVTDYGLKGNDEADLIMRNFLEHSEYLLLWVVPFYYHSRLFMINYKSRECIRRYFCTEIRAQ